MPVMVTTEWLREFVPNGPDNDTIAERLVSLGFAVDSIEDLGGGNARLVLDVTANRGDCWSVLGIARELAAGIAAELKWPEFSFSESGEPVSKSFAIAVEDASACPRYTARLIRGVRLGSSPEWIQRRLESFGIRPISNVVDVTNYVMLEMGHPLHAFDASLIRGNKLIVRRARKGEHIKLIDGSSKELSPEDIVIADAERPVALAGVMGGVETEINPSTCDVLLESASFDPVSIRRTSRRHGISTESSIRFEHGVDPAMVELASRRAARLLADCAGGKVAPGVLDSNPHIRETREIVLRRKSIKRLLGCELPSEEIERILKALGLKPVDASEPRRWLIPSWRRDISIEADLVEELARVYGYERLSGESTMRVFSVKPNPIFDARRRARDLLTAIGYTEICGASFFPEDNARFPRASVTGCGLAWDGAAKGYKVVNPIRTGEDTLRTSLVSSLLAAKLANQNRGRNRVRLFEVAPVCVPGKEEPDERLAVLDDAQEGEDGSPELLILRVKGTLEMLFERLGGGMGFVLDSPPDGLLPDLEEGRIIKLAPSDRPVGILGILSESAAKHRDLRTCPAVLELDLLALAGSHGNVPRMRPLPQFPGVIRDVALVLDESKTWADIESVSRKHAHPWRTLPSPIPGLKEIVYRGKPIPLGKKSIAFRVIYRAQDRTLTDEEVNKLHEEYVKALCGALGAEVRK